MLPFFVRQEWVAGTEGDPQTSAAEDKSEKLNLC